jgi:transposase-like protein
MSASRRRFERGQKATILKRYLVDKVPLSDLCDEYGIKPNQIYTWQKTLFDHAAGRVPVSAAGRATPRLCADVR